MSTADEDVGVRYRSARLRLGETLATLDAPQWDLTVDACPGWRVRDVLAHLVGVIEDAMAGRLTGPPPPAQTREQVDRHRHQEPAALLDEWNALGAGFEDALSSLGIWPAFMDVLSHEHDIRAALGDQSYRDHDDVDLAAERLTDTLPSGVQITIAGRTRGSADSEPAARLTATSFEVLRLRLGRRSSAQVLAMDWEGDPAPFLPDLFIFGPASQDRIE